MCMPPVLAQEGNAGGASHQKFVVIVFFTFTTDGEGGYVFTPLCLSVCLSLCVGYLKKLGTDSDETRWTDWVCDKDELIRFW